MEKRQKVDLHLRVSPKLKEFLVQQAEKDSKTINSFCTDILSNVNLVRATITKAKAEKESLKLFSAMSHNINQIARYCNNTGKAATEAQLQFVLEEAETMKKEIIDEIRRKGVVIRGDF